MGISTVASYRNSQLFETVGLDDEVRDEFFEELPRHSAASRCKISCTTLSPHTPAHSQLPQLPCHAGRRPLPFPPRRRAPLQFSRARPPHARATSKRPRRKIIAHLTKLAETREPVAIRDLLDFAPATPSRSTKWKANPKSSAASARKRCLSARSAPKRIALWPSP